jgi:adenylate kinase family enzyme
MVYGVTGSGKSTAAARISEAIGIPWTAVDDLTWEPGWVEVPDEEQRRRIEEICAGPSWLLDTAYSRWLEVPLARVELIVALDYPRWFSLQRLVRRTVARVIDKRPVCNGNTETLRQMLSRDSIIAWHFRSFRKKRERIARWARQGPPRGDGPHVARFTAARDLQQWIDSLAPVR